MSITEVEGKQGHAPVKYVCTQNTLFCISQISLRSQGCREDEVYLAAYGFGDINTFKTVVCVRLTCINTHKHHTRCELQKTDTHKCFKNNPNSCVQTKYSARCARYHMLTKVQLPYILSDACATYTRVALDVHIITDS